MTAGPPWGLDYDAVVERPVSRASLLLYARGPTLLLDADCGEVVALPGIPRDGMQRPLALSPDGTRLLLWCLEDNGRTILLVALDLDTGERLRLPAPRGCFDYFGAWSPDGRAIATLSNATDDSGVIDIVGLASRQRRRLWSDTGGASDPTASIAWSPDGRLVAATYYHAGTDDSAAVVVDVDTATVVTRHERRMLRGCPNGTWVDSHGLVLVDSTSFEHPWPRFLLDVRSGNARRLAPWSHARELAIVAGGTATRDRDGGISLANIDGGNPRRLLTVIPKDLDISIFDIVASNLALED